MNPIAFIVMCNDTPIQIFGALGLTELAVPIQGGAE